MPSDERARIRAIMYQPSKVWLATENSGDRWLTDQFVMLNVTDTEVVDGLPDGAYQLMATGAWRAEERDSVPEPDIEGYFKVMASHTWYRAEPSEWSVAEHPGKAMLWSAHGAACLLGESTWASIKRHHPDCMVSYAHNRKAGVFRFSDGPFPFAYAAGIQIPEGQECVAHAIITALVSTSNPV